MVRFEVFSENESGRKQLYSQGKLTFVPRGTEPGEDEYIDLATVRERCHKVIDGKDAYPQFRSLGLGLGPSFQVLQEVLKSEQEILGVLKIPEIRNSNFEDFLLHPSLVDGSLQAGMGANIGNENGEMFVPYSIGEVEILHPLQPECFSYVQEVKDPNSKVSKGNVSILDSSGKVLVKIKDSIGVPLMDVHEKPSDQEMPSAAIHYSPEWQQLDAAAPQAAAGEAIVFFDTNEQLCQAYRQQLTQAGF